MKEVGRLNKRARFWTDLDTEHEAPYHCDAATNFSEGRDYVRGLMDGGVREHRNFAMPSKATRNMNQSLEF